jgi:glucose-1-phosphate adenylyltransferase
MGRLGHGRPKPLVPFGGTSRLIDFSLRNARDSGLGEVLLLPQYEERQLMDDLHRVWNTTRAFRVHFGPYDTAYRAAAPGQCPDVLPPPPAQRERGTADALIKKARHVFGPTVSEVLVLHSDHVYRYDYREMLRGHRASGAALTVSYQRIEKRYVHLFGMVEFDTDGRLVSFVEKPAHPTSDLVFAAFCVFDAAVLHRYLELLEGTDWQHDISRDVIPAMLAGGELIRGHPVRGHWEDIGTVERYHRAHMALVSPRSTLPLADLPRTIHPGTPRMLTGASEPLTRCIVPEDLVCEGTLADSVVFPGVSIGPGASVTRSVLLPGAHVPEGTAIDSAIVLEDGSVQRVDEATGPVGQGPHGHGGQPAHVEESPSPGRSDGTGPRPPLGSGVQGGDAC